MDSDAHDVPARKREDRVSLFRTYALFPHMTVFENISLRMSFGGRHGNTLKVLSHRKEALYPHQLSGGREAEDGHSQDAGGLSDLIMFDG